MVIEKREGRETYEQATHTRCVVEFHSDDNPNTDAIVIGADNGADPRFGHLLSVKTSKTLAACSGTFSIVIKKPPGLRRQESLLKFWKDPEDVWVRIYWVVDGQRIHVMTGLIDSINESMVRDNNGKRVETYTIEGRDFGKILETMQLWVNLPNTGLDVPASLARYMNNAMPKNPNVGTPGAWVKWWLEGWVANGGLAEVQWQLPRSLGGMSFYDALDLKNIQDMDEGNGLLADATGYEPDLENGFGKLWDKMVEYSNEVLNELWVDLDSNGDSEDRKMMIYLRERPFPTRLSGVAKWSMVKQHVLEPYDVYQRNMSKGGSASRFNYWLMSLDGRLVPADERALVVNGRIDSADNGKPGGVPIWNQESIVRHGVRRWEQSTMFLSGMIAAGGDVEKAWPKVLANWLRRCHDWYVATPMQLSGTITSTRALPEIRVGQRLKENREEGAIEYYIEGVDNMWSYPNASRTQVTCTYGTYEGENPLDFIYRQMEDPKSVRLAECSAHPESVEGTVDFLTQGCRFEPHSAEGGPETLLLTHGGEGFELGGSPTLPDASALEEAGKSMLEEGAADVFGSSKPQADPSMIPNPDIENDQARELATGNVSAAIRKPPGSTFGADQLKRNEDPLAGYDEADATDDPTYGLADE